MAIQSFGDKTTESFYSSGTITRTVGWRVLAKVAIRKPDMLNYAKTLDDLKAPPNNRLEKLRGSLNAFHSIRINDQWRIVFQWTTTGPAKVRIIDCH